MSFILDALKKAEQERGFGEVPGIESLHDQPPQRPGRRWPWVIVAVLLLTALVVAWLWSRLGAGPGDGPTASARPAEAVTEGAPARGPVRRPVASRSDPAAPVESPAPPVQPDSAGAAAEPPTAPPAIARRPLRPLPLPAPAPAPAPAKTEALQAEAGAASARAPAAVPIAPPEFAEPRAPGPPSPPQAEAAWKRLPLWPAVPDEIFRQVRGGLVLNAHVYSEYPPDRFVLLNMRKYREGDRMSEGPYLEEITREGVIFAVPDGRFRLEWRR
jgi:general secretion pathway protein B